MPKCHAEYVEIADDELAHSVDGVVEILHDVTAILDTSIEAVYIVFGSGDLLSSSVLLMHACLDNKTTAKRTTRIFVCLTPWSGV